MSKKISLWIVIWGIVFFAFINFGHAQAMQILEAEADAKIRTDVNARRNDNYGCGPFLFVGTSRGGGGIPRGGPDAIRSLIRFDLSGTAQPVTSAILELTMVGDQGTLVYTVDVHRIIDSGPLTPWIEGNGTVGFFTSFPPGCVHVDPANGVAWVGAGDGGDANNQTQPNFDPTIVASTIIDGSIVKDGDVVQWDVTSLVNDWINGIVPNHGVMLRDLTTSGTFRHIIFGAREGKLFNIPVSPFNVQDGPRLILTSGPTEPTELAIDIKPQSCPNAFNTKSKGVLPVAILGTQDLDVNDINVSSIELEGIPALRSNIEDVTTPVSDPQDECECTTDGADGFDDLGLKFDKQLVLAALGPVNDGDNVVLTLTGALNDGTAIEGVDCVIIKSKGGNLNKSIVDGPASIPQHYALLQNYPNPFNPETEIRFGIPESNHVVLTIFDILGNEIRTLVDAQYNAGDYSIRWDARDNAGNPAPSGVYLYQLQAGSYTQVKKMSLLR